MSYAYIITPYSDNDQSVVDSRFRIIHNYVAEQLAQGIIVFSTVVHCHMLTHTHNMPKDYEFWRVYCRAMLIPAKACHLLLLDGWEQSIGVSDELKVADEHNIPVHRICMTNYIT